MNQRKSPYTGTRASVYGDFSVLCKKSVSLLPRGRSCFFWGHICILHFVCGLSSVRSHVGSGLVFPGKIILPTRHLRQRWRRRSGREILSVSPRRSQSAGQVRCSGVDHRCAWNCNLLWRMFFVHEIPQNGKRWKEDRRSDVCVGERHAAERTCGLIFCVYDISSLGIGSSVQAHSISAAITNRYRYRRISSAWQRGCLRGR